MNIAMFFGMFFSVGLIQAASDATSPISALPAAVIEELYALCQKEAAAAAVLDTASVAYSKSYMSSPDKAAEAAKLEVRDEEAIAKRRAFAQAHSALKAAEDSYALLHRRVCGTFCQHYGDIHRAYNDYAALRIRCKDGGEDAQREKDVATEVFNRLLNGRKQEVAAQYIKMHPETDSPLST